MTDWIKDFEEMFVRDDGLMDKYVQGIDTDETTMAEAIKSFITHWKDKWEGEWREIAKQRYLDGLAEGQSWTEQEREAVRKDAREEKLREVLEVIERKINARKTIGQMIKENSGTDEEYLQGYEGALEDLKNTLNK